MYLLPIFFLKKSHMHIGIVYMLAIILIIPGFGVYLHTGFEVCPYGDYQQLLE